MMLPNDTPWDEGNANIGMAPLRFGCKFDKNALGIVEMQYNLSRADSDRNPIKFYGHIKNLESTARAELFYLVKCKCCDTSRRIEKLNLK